MRRSGVKFLLVLSLGVSIKRTDVYSTSVSRDSFISGYLGEFEELDGSIACLSLGISAFLHLRVYFNSS